MYKIVLHLKKRFQKVVNNYKNKQPSTYSNEGAFIIPKDEDYLRIIQAFIKK